jgi:preprotein translocase subunit YajC
MKGRKTMDPIAIGGIILIFVVMYFLMIRPQKKKEKAITEMRNSLGVGDQVVTIGGIKGKISAIKDDSLVLQVGSEKTKIEFMRWAISRVEQESANKKSAAPKEEIAEEKATPVKKPRKLSAAKETDETEDDKPKSPVNPE